MTPQNDDSVINGPRLVADNPHPGLSAHRLGKSFKKRPVLRAV